MSDRRDRPPRRADLSQHFLRSPALAASLVASAPVGRADLVIEIGPGRGVLTRALARRAREVRGVELDPRLCEELRAGFRDDPSVSIVHGDFLRYRLPGDRGYKVVGNIPFARTAEIIGRLMSAPRLPDDVVLIVQREAGERFAGSPFARETESSLRLKPWWQVEIVRRLQRSDFQPAPRVDCVVLHLALRARPLIDASASRGYQRFVSRTFGKTGNSVGRCLRGVFSARQIRRLGRDLRFDPASAPGELTFDQWLALFRFYRLVGADRAASVRHDEK